MENNLPESELPEVQINQLSFQGILLNRQPVRFSPAGIAICEGFLLYFRIECVNLLRSILSPCESGEQKNVGHYIM